MRRPVPIIELCPDLDTVFAHEHSRRELQDILQRYADRIAADAGFDVVSISVPNDRDELEVLALAGSDPDSLVGATMHRVETTHLIHGTRPWGTWRLHCMSSSDDTVRADGRHPWRPGDLLLAPVYDSRGRLAALVSVDLPRDGARPTIHGRQLLERFAVLAGRAVLSATDSGRSPEGHA